MRAWMENWHCGSKSLNSPSLCSNPVLCLSANVQYYTCIVKTKNVSSHGRHPVPPLLLTCVLDCSWTILEQFKTFLRIVSNFTFIKCS